MSIAAVFGSTGSVGSNILTTLLSVDTIASIQTISRRPPSPTSPKVNSILEQDTTKWSNLLSTLTPTPTTVFNAVGTTRAQAGSIQAQWKIDHDLCIATAQAAKQAGVKTYVLISSAGIRSPITNLLPYSKMKIGVEDAIKALDFENAIILRPGAILGEEKHPKGSFLIKIIQNSHRVSSELQDKFSMRFNLFFIPLKFVMR